MGKIGSHDQNGTGTIEAAAGSSAAIGVVNSNGHQCAVDSPESYSRLSLLTVAAAAASSPQYHVTHHQAYDQHKVLRDEEAGAGMSGCMDATSLYWKLIVWHGGSVYDAWLNAVSVQVGQVILSMPSSFAQTGIVFGIFFQLLYAGIGVWTCYLLSALYLEYRHRREREGITFKHHVIQYPEVMGYLIGPWARRAALFFNSMSMGSMAVVQLIACASNVYYLDGTHGLDKRQWTIVFGALSMLAVLIPTIYNYRVFSFLGAITTTYTAWYMFFAALTSGQVKGVKHSGPQSLQLFFTGTTNLLFAFGGHAITVEIMHAMWRPKSYKLVYVLTVVYVLTITMPHSVAVYWAYGDLLLHKSNAFALLPKSSLRDASIILMVIHQTIAFGMYMVPLNLTWEKTVGVHQSRFLWRVLARIPIALLLWCIALAFPFFGPLNSLIGSLITSISTHIIPCAAYLITFKNTAARQNAAEKPSKWMPRWPGMVFINSSIIAVILVLGTGFGSWASISSIVAQVHSFGIFQRCYQCSVTYVPQE